jgi:elongation factor Ts
LAKDVALQVAAMNPQYVSLESVPSAEKDLFLSTAKQELATSGKPADMIETIAMGKFMKHYADLVLLEQSSIKDDSKKVRDLVHGRLHITQIKRYAI